MKNLLQKAYNFFEIPGLESQEHKLERITREANNKYYVYKPGGNSFYHVKSFAGFCWPDTNILTTCDFDIAKETCDKLRKNYIDRNMNNGKIVY